VVLLLGGIGVWDGLRDKRVPPLFVPSSFMPKASITHQKTWILFPNNSLLYDDFLLLMGTIVQYEPLSIIVSPKNHQRLLTLLADTSTHHYPIEIVPMQTDENFMDAIAPLFLFSPKNEAKGLNTHLKIAHNQAIHAKITDEITHKALFAPIHSNLMFDRSAIEVDGWGTAIVSEDTLLNQTNNPYWNKEQIEVELKQMLGLKRIIWLKTKENNAVNLYARFVAKDTILLHKEPNQKSNFYLENQNNIEILRNATTLENHPFTLIFIEAPMSDRTSTSLLSYLGYYHCNGAVLLPQFGDDRADYEAYETLQTHFKESTIEPLRLDNIFSLGSSISRAVSAQPTKEQK